jgi:hypothetical protein
MNSGPTGDNSRDGWRSKGADDRTNGRSVIPVTTGPSILADATMIAAEPMRPRARGKVFHFAEMIDTVVEVDAAFEIVTAVSHSGIEIAGAVNACEPIARNGIIYAVEAIAAANARSSPAARREGVATEGNSAGVANEKVTNKTVEPDGATALDTRIYRSALEAAQSPLSTLLQNRC